MQGSGLVEEGRAVRLGLMKIDYSEVYGGWYHSQRRIVNLRWCFGGTHGFVGCYSHSYGQMELDSRGSHSSRYWGATTRYLR